MPCQSALSRLRDTWQPCRSRDINIWLFYLRPIRHIAELLCQVSRAAAFFSSLSLPCDCDWPLLWYIRAIAGSLLRCKPCSKIQQLHVDGVRNPEPLAYSPANATNRTSATAVWIPSQIVKKSPRTNRSRGMKIHTRARENRAFAWYFNFALTSTAKRFRVELKRCEWF